MKKLYTFFATILVVSIAACGGGGSTIPSAGMKPATKSGLPKPSAAVKRHIALPQSTKLRHVRDASGNLADAGFESGGFSVWQQCGSTGNNATMATDVVHSGSYAQRSGPADTVSGELNGDTGVCQQVTIPASGVVSFYVNETSSEPNTSTNWQEADLLDNTGATVANFYMTVANDATWNSQSFDVSAYAGQTLWLYFGVHGDGNASNYTIQYVDDVSLGGAASTPTPGPTATPVVTSTPFATPTPSGGPTPVATPAGQGNQSCGTSCGVQRWHIKTLDDGDVGLINWMPQVVNVSDLTNAPVPAGYDQYNDTTRYTPYETQAYTIRATLVGWKTEADHDFHIVIADINNPSNTMIIEPPDPHCSAACASNFGNYYQAVRDKLTACYGPVPSGFTNFPSGVVVDVTGVPLFDALHGQTGVAPNGIELHPLLNLNFVSGGC